MYRIVYTFGYFYCRFVYISDGINNKLSKRVRCSHSEVLTFQRSLLYDFERFADAAHPHSYFKVSERLYCISIKLPLLNDQYKILEENLPIGKLISNHLSIFSNGHLFDRF